MDVPSTIGKRVSMKLRGQIERGIVVDEIWLPHIPENSPKEYLKGVQKVEFSDSRFEYRFGYYERDKGSKSWRWGQYAMFLPEGLIKELIQKMKEKGWL